MGKQVDGHTGALGCLRNSSITLSWGASRVHDKLLQGYFSLGDFLFSSLMDLVRAALPTCQRRCSEMSGFFT